jgi:hypothetical protein
MALLKRRAITQTVTVACPAPHWEMFREGAVVGRNRLVPELADAYASFRQLEGLTATRVHLAAEIEVTSADRRMDLPSKAEYLCELKALQREL